MENDRDTSLQSWPTSHPFPAQVVVSGETAYVHARRLDAAAHVPPLITTLVKLEYEGLADEEKLVLQAASVLPRAFTFRDVVVAVDVFRRFFQAANADSTLHANLRVASLVETLVLDDVLTLAPPEPADDATGRASLSDATAAADGDGASFLDQILFLCKKTDADAQAALPSRPSFADDVDSLAYSALEEAEDHRPPNLKFRNHALRDYVVSIMSSSKRTALKDAMAAWHDSSEVGLAVAKQVRRGKSTFSRTLGKLGGAKSRKASRRSSARAADANVLRLEDPGRVRGLTRGSVIDVGRDQASAHLQDRFK